MKSADAVGGQRDVDFLGIGQIQPRHDSGELLFGFGEARVVLFLLADCGAGLTCQGRG